MIVKYSFIILVFGFLLSACRQTSQSDIADGSASFQPIERFNIDIQYPTGSMLPESILKSKVPTMFNVGKLADGVYGMLLGPSVAKNRSYEYLPIGVYTLKIDSVDMAFVLCKANEEESYITVDSYHDWSLEEIRYKNLIDNWFKTNCELNACSNMLWANDLKALRILELVR